MLDFRYVSCVINLVLCSLNLPFESSHSYIIDCLDAGYKLPMRGFYYLNISPSTRKAMEGFIDPFGDRYVSQITRLHELFVILLFSELSFVDDVLPPELSKILHIVDDSIARLERKQAMSTSSTTNKRKAAAIEQMGALTSSERQLILDWNRKIKGKW